MLAVRCVSPRVAADAELLACVRRTTADVDALVADAAGADAAGLAALRTRITFACRRAILHPGGAERDRAWRELCRGIAALLDFAPRATAGGPAAPARSRLRALLRENEDLLV
jgi:hypothetical protein